MTGLVLRAVETVRRPPPANLRAGEEGLFAHEYERVLGATSLWNLGKVTALPNGHLLEHGRLLREGFSSAPRGTRALIARVRALQYLLTTRTSRVERALWITDEFSNGFFHWICDVLPRLELMDGSEGADRTLVVPAMAHFGYAAETLRAFRLGSVRLLSWNERVSCCDLAVVDAAAPTGNYRPDLMRRLRDRMRGLVTPGKGGRRIYISRSGAAVRRIANEAEIVPVLERLGFEIVRTEGIPFSDQVSLMGSASVLVSNHGAGLTHICWMNPGTTVLELRRRGDRWNNCYYSLAGALGITYRYLSCGVVDDRQPTHTANLVVDAQQLGRELAQIG